MSDFPHISREMKEIAEIRDEVNQHKKLDIINILKEQGDMAEG